MVLCSCGHPAESHWRNTKHCLGNAIDLDSQTVSKCPCLAYSPSTKTQLSVLLNEEGKASIMFLIADTKIQFSPDSLADLALGMLATVYHARGQEALAAYALKHNIPLPELLA